MILQRQQQGPRPPQHRMTPALLLQQPYLVIHAQVLLRLFLHQVMHLLLLRSHPHLPPLLRHCLLSVLDLRQ